MGDFDHYDYTEDKDDTLDTIDFGKFRGYSPKKVLTTKPGYLVWAYENTNKWVGSTKLIKKAYAACGLTYRERSKDVSVHPETVVDQETIDKCEQAILDAYGVFPVKERHTKNERVIIPGE